MLFYLYAMWEFYRIKVNIRNARVSFLRNIYILKSVGVQGVFNWVYSWEYVANMPWCCHLFICNCCYTTNLRCNTKHFTSWWEHSFINLNPWDYNFIMLIYSASLWIVLSILQNKIKFLILQLHFMASMYNLVTHGKNLMLFMTDVATKKLQITDSITSELNSQY